jgi:hypothetical protein
MDEMVKQLVFRFPQAEQLSILGGAGVTTASYGYELLGGTSFAVELQQGEQVFGVVASSTQTVNVFRQGA